VTTAFTYRPETGWHRLLVEQMVESLCVLHRSLARHCVTSQRSTAEMMRISTVNPATSLTLSISRR